jgi:Outer membrane protein
MFKKIALLALLMVPAFGFAQESLKIGYFNFNEVMPAMPEYTQMTDTLQKTAAMFQEEMALLNAELEKKYTDYVEQRETLAESIRLRREQEIQDLSQRAGNFQQQAQQSQEMLYQKLYAEIQEKLQKVVQQVGEENHFTYIMDANSMWFVSPRATDATPLVKQKLGLQ